MIIWTPFAHQTIPTVGPSSSLAKTLPQESYRLVAILWGGMGMEWIQAEGLG